MAANGDSAPAEVRNLIADRLLEIDRLRVRRQLPIQYWFVGERKTGEVATFRFKQARQGDAKPADGLHWADSLFSLRRWFEHETDQTGINVRRWKRQGD